jgi:hypothetical protein
VRGLERTAGVLSFLAGAVHGAAAPQHFALWWAYGAFFAAAGVGQAAYGILLLTQGIEGWGGWSAVRGKVYWAGIAATLAIIALWLVTRTIGVPAGPEAGEVEPVGVLDLSSKVLEVALVACLARLLALRRRATSGAG